MGRERSDRFGETKYDRRAASDEIAVALAIHHSQKSRLAVLLNYQDRPEEAYQSQQAAEGPIAQAGDIHPNEPNWEAYRDPLDQPYWDTVRTEEPIKHEPSAEAIASKAIGRDRIKGQSREANRRARGKAFKRVVRIDLSQEPVSPAKKQKWQAKAAERERRGAVIISTNGHEPLGEKSGNKDKKTKPFEMHLIKPSPSQREGAVVSSPPITKDRSSSQSLERQYMPVYSPTLGAALVRG